MFYVNVALLSSIKRYKIKYKKKEKEIRKVIKLALSAALICSIAKGNLWTTNKNRQKQTIEMSVTIKVTHPNRREANPEAPLTYFNDGGVRQRFTFHTQKNPNFRICLPKKIPQCFCISKFYYFSSEITESATHLCMGS